MEKDTEPQGLVPKSNSQLSKGPLECSKAVIDEYLLRFSAAYAHEPNPLVASIFREHLSLLPRSVVLAGFKHVEQTFQPTSACPFPTVAHVMEFINKSRAMNVAATAEDLWQKWLPIVTRYADPDIGWRGPRVPERINHAIRAAGGMAVIRECPKEDLVWRKKAFIECYERDESLPEYQGAAIENDATRMIADAAKRKSV